MVTPAQRRAQSRYDRTRPRPLAVRLNAEQMAWLDAQRAPREGRQGALKRLAGVPDLPRQD